MNYYKLKTPFIQAKMRDFWHFELKVSNVYDTIYLKYRYDILTDMVFHSTRGVENGFHPLPCERTLLNVCT